METQAAWYSYEDAIQLADDEVFLSAEFLNQLAQHVVTLNMSRRKMAEWIAEHLNALDGAYDVFDGNGRWMDFHDEILSEAFGDDESFKYLSDVLRYAERPATRKPSDFMLLRFQLLAIAFLREGDPITL
ncbi:hypothetical protein [Maricaulis sp.]|uniref:hypothetical protein n=1 Tax=Maricaulis sp. TaxID=1486257 RepID=UPI0026184D6E|nr:hypothetical protein [Maricaulis sp.]